MRIPLGLLATLSLAVVFQADAQLRPTVELVEELRIDGGAGPEILTTVHPLVTDRAGERVYVGQRMENLVRIFDAESGDFIRRFGRTGSGPGEFQGMIHMGWTGDTLVIVDQVLDHASFFSPTGQHIRSDRIASEPIPDYGVARVIATLDNGTVVGSPGFTLGPANARASPRIPFVQMSRSGAVLRTLGYYDVSEASGEATLGDRYVVFQMPMSQRSFLTTAPGGDGAFVTQAPTSTEARPTFSVTRLGVEGDTVYHRSFRYTPRPLPPSANEELDRAAERMFPGAPVALARQTLREAVKLPPFQRPVSEVVAGWDGELWLRHAELPDGRAVWLILSPTGDISGMAQVPGGLTIKTVQGEAVWGVIHDEWDVPSVVRYRVRPLRQ